MISRGYVARMTHRPLGWCGRTQVIAASEGPHQIDPRGCSSRWRNSISSKFFNRPIIQHQFNRIFIKLRYQNSTTERTCLRYLSRTGRPPGCSSRSPYPSANSRAELTRNNVLCKIPMWKLSLKSNEIHQILRKSPRNSSSHAPILERLAKTYP